KTHAQAIAFSPDGRLLASTHPGNAVRVWGAGPGQLLAEHKSPATAYTWTVAFSPDGRYLAAGGGSGLALWELGVKAAEAKLDVPRRPAPAPDARLASGWKPQRLVFSRGGERLAWVQTGVHWGLDEPPDRLKVYVWKIGDPKGLFEVPRRAICGGEALA